MRKRFSIRTVLFLVLAALLTTACQKETTTAQSRRGGKVTIGLSGSIETLFPFDINEYFTRDISQFLLNPSFTAALDENTNTAQIAGAWQTSDDTRSITYFLNNNYRWSNGRTVNAHDVLTTFNYIQQHAQLARAFPYLDTLIVIDSATVRIRLTSPVSDLERWTRLPIVFFGKNPLNTPLEELQRRFNKSYVGCGPFVLSYKDQKKMLLVRNPYFPAPKPYLDSLEFRFYPNTDALAAAVSKEEVDIVPSLPVQMVKQLRLSKNYQMDSQLESGFDFIAWNLSSPLVKSLAIRKALTYALDRQTLVDGLLDGYGFVHENPAPPDFWAYHQEPLIPYNPQQALTLLQSEGWKKREQDGLLVRRNKPFKLRLLTNQENRLRQDLLNNISAYYHKLGIIVQAEILPWAKFMRRIRAGKYDGAVVGWGANPSSSLREIFHSSQIEHGSNLMGYRNRLVDQLLTAALTEPNSRRAKEACLRAQEQIVRDLPVTVLFTKKEIRLASKRIRNLNLHHKSIFADAADWYIK